MVNSVRKRGNMMGVSFWEEGHDNRYIWSYCYVLGTAPKT